MTPKIPRKDTAGVRDRPLDTFGDVKSGLNAWLLKNDPAWRKRSEDSQRRSIESHERKRRERLGLFEMKMGEDAP